MNWLNRNAALIAGIGIMLLVALFAPMRSFPQILSPIVLKTTSVPPPPLAGMLVWWSADVGTSTNCAGPCSDGSSQSTWVDRSGNGNNGGLNFVPSVAMPCVASVYHTNQINGKPALTFNGVSVDGSETCFTVPGVSGGLDNKATTTEFIVAQMVFTTNRLTFSGGGGGSLKWDAGSNSGTYQRIAQGSTADIGLSTDAGDANWHQANVTYNSSTGAYAFRNNRVSDGSGTNAKSITGNWLDIGITLSGGSISTFQGQIAEFILYNRVLSGTEITTVETYLHSKYGL